MNLDGLVTEELQKSDHVDTQNSNTEQLISLLRSITKDEVLYLLREKYGIQISERGKLEGIALSIESNIDCDGIVSDLDTIRSCYRDTDEETFRTLCIEYYGVNIHFQDSFKRIIIKCLIQAPQHLSAIKAIAAVNKQKNFSVFQGKKIDTSVELTDEVKENVSIAIQKLIDATEPGRKYTVEMRQVQQDLLLIAYFDDRTKTFFQISTGRQVESITITPASRAQARYNTEENRLYLKCGTSSKIRKYLLESFGQALYKNNSHFLESNEVYKLDEIKDDLDLTIDEELQENVESVFIIEEVLKIPLPDQEIVLTVKGKNAESALEYLSNDKINIKNQQRKSLTLQLVLKQKDNKTKTVNITITDSNKISYDPRYTDIVHRCLVKWGIEIIGKETDRNRIN